MAEEENIGQFKVILIGDSGVGKTAIIGRFSEDEFRENHISTIGVDFRYKHVEVDGGVVRLQVWDTAGQERYRTITKSYYREAQAIIVVYAINDKSTFQSVRTWLSEIDKNVSTPIIKYLVGNKADLEYDRCIDEETGRSEAESFGVKFFETSAKTSQNIEELFTSIAKDLKETVKPVTPATNTVKIGGSSQKPKSKSRC